MYKETRQQLKLERLKLKKVKCEIRIAKLEMEQSRENTYQRSLY